MTLRKLRENYAISYGFDGFNQMSEYYYLKGNIKELDKHHSQIAEKYAKLKLEKAARSAKIKMEIVTEEFFPKNDDWKHTVYKTEDFPGLNIKTPFFYYEEIGEDIYLWGCDNENKENPIEITKLIQVEHSSAYKAVVDKDSILNI